MTWPPRTILALSVAAVLIVLVVAATLLPWYRRLPLSRVGRVIVVAGVVIFLLVLIARIVFIVPAYWD